MSEKTPYDEIASKLYAASLTDWHVTVVHVLTEPCCAFVDVVPEDDDLPHLKGFIGRYDVNESIRLACEYMLQNLETFYRENPDRRPTP